MQSLLSRHMLDRDAYIIFVLRTNFHEVVIYCVYGERGRGGEEKANRSEKRRRRRKEQAEEDEEEKEEGIGTRGTKAGR